MVTRREFINICFKAGILATLSSKIPDCISTNAFAKTPLDDLIDNKHIYEIVEARYYKKLEDKKIECNLCPRKCVIGDRERGFCGNRENRDGSYYTLVYGNPCALHIDPMEKKPLFHFLPGSQVLSLATAGCNIVCKFCQNWEISQFRPEQIESYHLPPKDLVELAINKKSPSIAFTYSEPVVFYEYMYDTAVIGKERGIKTVMISNGYIQAEPMKELCKYLSAVKIDFKAFTEKFYKETCKGELKPVLDTLQLLRDIGIWYELVYLIVPTLNDTEKEFKDMSIWIKDTLGVNVPIHFTRFYPQYMLKNLPPTPISTLELAWKTARNVGLNYVYIGNVPGHQGENTICHKCNKTIIKRTGFSILENNIQNGKCKFCNENIPGVWN